MEYMDGVDGNSYFNTYGMSAEGPLLLIRLRDGLTGTPFRSPRRSAKSCVWGRAHTRTLAGARLQFCIEGPGGPHGHQAEYGPATWSSCKEG